MFKADGTITAYLEPENSGLLLLGLMGETIIGIAIDTTVYEHIFYPGSSLTTLTLGIGTDVTAGEKEYTSCQIRSAEFSLVAGELVTLAWDIVPETIDTTTLQSPTYSDLEPFYFQQGVVKTLGTVGGTPDTDTTVKACKIKIENVINTDPTLGDRTLALSKVGAFKVTGSLDLEFTALTYIERFLGVGGATAPQNTLTEGELQLICTGEACGATPSSTYGFDIYLPKIVFDTSKVNPDKRDWTTQTVTFTGMYYTQAGAAITVFADAGGGQVTVTSAGHGLANGNWAKIIGTTSYNGTFIIANKTDDTFEITDTWVANDATGTWRTWDTHSANIKLRNLVSTAYDA